MLPSSINQYKILKCIAAGATSMIYLAKDSKNEKEVILKNIPSSLIPEVWLSEISILAKLSHPNVVKIYEVFTYKNEFWIAAENIDGKSIFEALPKCNNFKIESFAANIFLQLLNVLDYLHGKNIYHLDLRPSNLFVTVNKTLKIIDLGRSNVATHNHDKYVSIGCPSYMTPEHIKNIVCLESDYFVVGTLLYEYVSGSNPFKKETIFQTFDLLHDFDPKQIISSCPHIDKTCSKLLSYIWAPNLLDRHDGWKVLRKYLTEISIGSESNKNNTFCNTKKLNFNNQKRKYLNNKEIKAEIYKYDVFISHSSKDRKYVDEIIKEFRSKNISYWVDHEQIEFGDPITQKIEEGLRESHYVLVLLSTHLGKSNWCRTEYGPILNKEFNEESQKKVIPLRLEDCSDNEIPLLLCDKKRVDYSNREEFNRLLEYLKS